MAIITFELPLFDHGRLNIFREVGRFEEFKDAVVRQRSLEDADAEAEARESMTHIPSVSNITIPMLGLMSEERCVVRL